MNNHVLTQNQPAEPPLNWAALIETALLGCCATMLLTKALRGVLVFYIHPRYTPLVFVCGIVLALLAFVRMRAIFGSPPEPITGQRIAYLALGVAVLLGTLVPARPLGASTVSVTSLAQPVGAGQSLIPEGDSRQWDLLQWGVALSVHGETLAGKPVDVQGFVFHDPAAEQEGFVIARYVLSCCTADGSATGMPVIWQGGSELPADSWVQVRGTLGTITRDGVLEPALLAESVELIEQPKNPYLYLSQ